MKLTKFFWYMLFLCSLITIAYRSYAVSIFEAPLRLTHLILKDFLVSLYLVFIVYFTIEILFYIFEKFAKNKVEILKNIIKFKKIFYSFIVIILAFMALVDILAIINFNTSFNSSVIDIILNTNFRESSEFIWTYLNLKNFLIIILFIIFSFAFLFIKPVKMHFVFAIVLFAISIYVFQKQIRKNHDYGVYYYSSKNYITRWISSITEMKSKFEVDLNTLLAKYEQNLKNDKNEILNSQNIPKVVLILGESTQRNYQSIYGYKLPTTPNLQNLVNSGNLVVFSDVISPHSHTHPVLRKALTLANYENSSDVFSDYIKTDDDWLNFLNIIDLMKKAGYSTTWISNQDQVSIFGNAQGVMARRADNAYFTSLDLFGAGRGGESYIFDEALLEIFDNLKRNLNDENSNEFFVFHLVGTHHGYHRRYGKKFAKFNAKDLEENGLNLMGSQTLNSSNTKERAHYLNAIYYNDFVVNEIIKRFKDQDAIIFYFSDHADEVYDFRDFKGHAETKSSRYQLEVPFIIFLSDKFKQNHAELAKNIEKAKNLPFMSDDFIHLFSDILGFSYKDFIPSKSPLSENFDAKRIRFASGYDYDVDLKDDFIFKNNLAPSRLWLHRTNSKEKFLQNYKKYQGFEFDINLLEISKNPRLSEQTLNILQQTLIPYYFDISHDGLDFNSKNSSTGFSLNEYFQLIKQKQDELKREFKFWLDFKNLSAENKNIALEILNKLCLEFDIKKENLIIESSDFASLGIFKQNGFKTSYYVPYYDLKTINKQDVKKHLQDIIKSNNIDYLSFAYYLYNFMKSLNLKDENENLMPFLTWNEGKNYKQNMQEVAFIDHQIDVILVGK